MKSNTSMKTTFRSTTSCARTLQSQSQFQCGEVPRSWQQIRTYRAASGKFSGVGAKSKMTTQAATSTLTPPPIPALTTRQSPPPVSIPAVGGTRFADHFHGKHDKPDTQGPGWCKLWDQNESALWDRGKPSPALIALVEERGDLVSAFAEDGTRRKALVPGCGRGYDVVMLAQHGFDAYGLEISSTAVTEANRYSTLEMAMPSAYNFRTHQNLPSSSPGGVSFKQGDFFTRDWEQVMSPSVEKGKRVKFDLVYDYTFLCAIIPETRRSWATRMADIIKPGGLLICLEFPLYKDPTLPGPPWGLEGVYWDLLAEGGDGRLDMRHSSGGEENRVGLEGDFERVLYVKPVESYEMGRGTDMLSVWRRKGKSCG